MAVFCQVDPDREYLLQRPVVPLLNQVSGILLSVRSYVIIS